MLQLKGNDDNVGEGEKEPALTRRIRQNDFLQEERAFSLLDSYRTAVQRQVCLKVESDKSLPIGDSQ